MGVDTVYIITSAIYKDYSDNRGKQWPPPKPDQKNDLGEILDDNRLRVFGFMREHSQDESVRKRYHEEYVRKRVFGSEYVRKRYHEEHKLGMRPPAIFRKILI